MPDEVPKKPATDSEEVSVPVTIKKTAPPAAPKPAAKPAAPNGEKIMVKVGRSQYDQVARTPAKTDDIPDELLPSSDEMKLDDVPAPQVAPKPAPVAPVEEAKQPADPESAPAPAVEEPKTDVPAKNPILERSVRAELEGEPTPEDEGKLEGFIYASAKPGEQTAAGVQPESGSAKAGLTNPNIYDTKTVYPSLSNSKSNAAGVKSGKSIKKIIGVVALILVLAASVYLMVDLNLLGADKDVPVEFFK